MDSIITIDPTARIGTIAPWLFGHFVEHLEHGVYGGIYEPGSPLSDDAGLRLDVLEAVRRLAPTQLRYPGGNFVSGYHWRDGVGPRGQRPVRFDHAWKALESNKFGTHEFMEYARLLSTSPYICVNLGNGTPEEAADWLEYCNGRFDTTLTRQRRDNGAAEPFNIPLWGLGNEIYGLWQIGRKSAAAYAEMALEAALRMREIDESIKLVACGWEDSREWNATVLETLAPHVDYLSLHLYIGSTDYLTAVAQPLLIEQLSRWHSSLARLVCRERGLTKTIPLAWDEWTVWFAPQDSAAVAETGLREVYKLKDVLTIACSLNALLRCADVVGLANLAQLVNVIAPILTTPTGIILQSIYWPLLLYRRTAGYQSLRPSLQCEGYRAQFQFRGWSIDEEVAYLDVAAALAPDSRTLLLGVVNRHPEAAIDTELRLVGLCARSEALAETVDGPELGAFNSIEHPNLVGVAARSWEVAPGRVRYSFPPHSLTLLTISLV